MPLRLSAGDVGDVRSLCAPPHHTQRRSGGQTRKEEAGENEFAFFPVLIGTIKASTWGYGLQTSILSAKREKLTNTFFDCCWISHVNTKRNSVFVW